MDFLLNMDPRINETVSDNISRDYMEDEVIKVLKQLHSTMAPSPSGMLHLFFQRH